MPLLAELKENRVFIYDSYIHKETIKEMPGRRWHPECKAWSVPCTSESLITLHLTGCKMSGTLLDKAQAAHQQSMSKNAPKSPLEPMPIKARPYAHQITGYNLACMALGIFAGCDTS